MFSLLWRKFLECSSSHYSLRHPCDLTHSYGGRFWSVLPHTAHFVIPVISLTPMEEGSGVFFLTAHFVIPVSSLTPMEEGSGVFFLTAHFVIPVISLLWRKVLECSSSPCSLRYPCDLTHSYGGSFWSVLPHCSLRHPCVLTHFVIPVFSHP